MLCKSNIGKKTKISTIKKNSMGKNLNLCQKKVVVTKSNKENSIVDLDNSTYCTKKYQLSNNQNYFKSLNDNE